MAIVALTANEREAYKMKKIKYKELLQEAEVIHQGLQTIEKHVLDTIALFLIKIIRNYTDL